MNSQDVMAHQITSGRIYDTDITISPPAYTADPGSVYNSQHKASSVSRAQGNIPVYHHFQVPSNAGVQFPFNEAQPPIEVPFENIEIGTTPQTQTTLNYTLQWCHSGQFFDHTGQYHSGS
jgi:hypothetical protein